MEADRKHQGASPNPYARELSLIKNYANNLGLRYYKVRRPNEKLKALEEEEDISQGVVLHEDYTRGYIFCPSTDDFSVYENLNIFLETCHNAGITSFYEVYFNRFNQKMRFDLDLKIHEWMRDCPQNVKDYFQGPRDYMKYLYSLILYFLQNYIPLNIRDDVVYCPTQRREKVSIHLIINHYYMNSETARSIRDLIVDDIIHYFSQNNIPFVDWIVSDVIDGAVYNKSGDFRLVRCSKNNGPKKTLQNKFYYFDEFISQDLGYFTPEDELKLTLLQYIEECNPIDEDNIVNIQKERGLIIENRNTSSSQTPSISKGNLSNNNSSRKSSGLSSWFRDRNIQFSDIQPLLNRVEELFPNTFDFDGTKANFVHLARRKELREKQEDIYCSLCQKYHSSDNMYISLNEKLEAFLMCYGPKHKKETAHLTPKKYLGNISCEYISRENINNVSFNSSVSTTSTTSSNFTPSSSMGDNIEFGDNNNLLSLKRVINRMNVESVGEMELEMRELTAFYVHLGGGKTHRLYRLTEQGKMGPRIYFLSPKNIYSYDIHHRFKNLGFTHYEDAKKGPYAWCMEQIDRLIIQLESLVRINEEEELDIDDLVLDEVEDMRKELLSKTAIKHINKIYRIVQKLLRTSKRITILDGNLTLDTLKWVVSERYGSLAHLNNPEKVIIHYNFHQPPPREFTRLDSLKSFRAKRLQSLETGRKIITVSSTKKFIDNETIDDYRQHLSDNQFKIYTRDSSDFSLKEIKERGVNEIWRYLQAIAFTAKISVGVNCTEPFDDIFVYIKNNPLCPDLETIFQMLHRVRFIQGRVYFYISNSSNFDLENYPLTLDGILKVDKDWVVNENLNTRRMMEMMKEVPRGMILNRLFIVRQRNFQLHNLWYRLRQLLNRYHYRGNINMTLSIEDMDVPITIKSIEKFPDTSIIDFEELRQRLERKQATVEDKFNLKAILFEKYISSNIPGDLKKEFFNEFLTNGNILWNLFNSKNAGVEGMIIDNYLISYVISFHNVHKKIEFIYCINRFFGLNNECEAGEWAFEFVFNERVKMEDFIGDLEGLRKCFDIQKDKIGFDKKQHPEVQKQEYRWNLVNQVLRRWIGGNGKVFNSKKKGNANNRRVCKVKEKKTLWDYIPRQTTDNSIYFAKSSSGFPSKYELSVPSRFNGVEKEELEGTCGKQKEKCKIFSCYYCHLNKLDENDNKQHCEACGLIEQIKRKKKENKIQDLTQNFLDKVRNNNLNTEEHKKDSETSGLIYNKKDVRFDVGDGNSINQDGDDEEGVIQDWIKENDKVEKEDISKILSKIYENIDWTDDIERIIKVNEIVYKGVPSRENLKAILIGIFPEITGKINEILEQI